MSLDAVEEEWGCLVAGGGGFGFGFINSVTMSTVSEGTLRDTEELRAYRHYETWQLCRAVVMLLLAVLPCLAGEQALAA